VVPEVIQTSDTDCGPACLKSVFAGLGLDIDYRLLRDACQTDVDGSSVDTMEELAQQLGFDAEQIMLPVDDVFLPEARALPAIVVVRQPGGTTHFVVVWRRYGPLVQAMDPQRGRYWTTCASLTQRLFVHTTAVPAADWREWAGSEEARGVFVRRLTRLGVRSPGAYLEVASSDPSWRSIAALDSALRAVDAMVKAGALARGGAAQALLDGLLAAAARGAPAVPDGYCSVVPGRAEPGRAHDDEQLLLTGAVLLRIRRRSVAAPRAEGEPAPVPPAIASALGAARVRPVRILADLLRTERLAVPRFLAAALGLVTAARLLQTLVMRGLLDVARDLTTVRQRAAAILVVLVVALLTLAVQFQLTHALLGIGRRLEIRLRQAFLQRLSGIDDRYFQSRLTSDMAMRSHSIQVMRTLPSVVAQSAALMCELAATTAAVVWLAPSTWAAAIGAASLTALVPLLAQWAFFERDLRVQTHNGALGRFAIDALLGLAPIRVHGAQASIRREQESLLVEWMKAGVGLQGISVWFEAVLLVATYGLVWLVISRYLHTALKPTVVLLLVFWALRYPIIGQRLLVLTRTFPSLVNRVRRLLEVMGAESREAPLEQARGRAPDPEPARGVAVSMADVQVKAGGHVLLDEVDLQIPAGSHVAVVGPSGAGKSTLLGLLLGWFQPARGSVMVDGRVLDAAELDRLRRVTAWVDPAVQIWNTSLVDNLAYGNEEAVGALPAVLEGAALLEVLEALPDGLQTVLGENGGLVSGGQGQRVRLGRAMLKAGARLVLLDEPFRGLDRQRRDRLLARARELWRGATLVCVTHDVAQTASFPHVLVVDEGKVVERGAPAQLLADPSSRYAALVRADEENRARMWHGKGWRQLWLGGGVLSERAS
jgi:ABC-type bacteriocin/lantibiotic exporter with double-glycine peptidase domain